jgi:hypothetical protein
MVPLRDNGAVRVALEWRCGRACCVALRDLAPITALPDSVLRGLATALAAGGLTVAVLAPIVERARGLHPLLRHPVHLAELRRTQAPWASLARAFVFEDPVERSELESAGIELEPLVACGLLRESESGLVSPFAMAVVDGLYIYSDPLHQGGDAVMGMGPLTIPLCTAVRPTRQLGRALDLGCGAGVVALLLSRRVRSVGASGNSRPPCSGGCDQLGPSMKNATSRIQPLRASSRMSIVADITVASGSVKASAPYSLGTAGVEGARACTERRVCASTPQRMRRRVSRGAVRRASPRVRAEHGAST